MEVLKLLQQYKNNLEEGLNILKEEFKIEHKVLNGKVLLKYGRTSDKSLKIVRECRGLILNIKTLEPISVMFEKFGNLSESYAANDIDITKSRVMEKLDGTCIGMYHSNIDATWHV